jgi:hypothetical protein
MTELKRCPWCREVPIKDKNSDMYMCATKNCPNEWNLFYSTEWNSRPIEDELNARIKELEDKIEDMEGHDYY